LPIVKRTEGQKRIAINKSKGRKGLRRWVNNQGARAHFRGGIRRWTFLPGTTGIQRKRGFRSKGQRDAFSSPSLARRRQTSRVLAQKACRTWEDINILVF